MFKKNKKFQGLIQKVLGISLMTTAIWGIYAYLLEHDWQIKTMTDSQFQKYQINEKDALNLYQIMKDTDEIFHKEGINYWIEGGTLLGAVRHQGLIPFDDDLDIAIMHYDEIKLQNALVEFEKLGYHIRYKNVYSICNKQCIDIFIFHHQSDKFICTNIIQRNKYPLDFFYSDELLPLKKYSFGELELQGPNEATKYLDRLYPAWDKYIILQPPHRGHFFMSKIEEKTKFLITPELLKPAMPLSPLQDRVHQ